MGSLPAAGPHLEDLMNMISDVQPRPAWFAGLLTALAVSPLLAVLLAVAVTL
ncbi:hypothetical protein [Pseudonocardia pini]|uniref:hypothetical protein n=1 Tax=Pseudonocardia pini TaxID=2758030 RepID=UPI0015F025DB|nr:hypothetical protein [Pseudonocardia pini]